MGNLASICTNPDEEKPNNTIYAVVGKKEVDEYAEEPEDKPEVTELHQEEAKEVEREDQDQEAEKPKESEGVFLNNDELTTNLIFEEKPLTFSGLENVVETKREEERKDSIENRYASITKDEEIRNMVKEEVKQVFEEVKAPVIHEKAKAQVRNVDTSNKLEVLDFTLLKEVHPSVETASTNDIRNATAAGVLEAEEDIAEPINYNEYTDGNINENYELPPCHFPDSGEFYEGNWNNEGLQEGKGYLIRRDGSKLEGLWSNGQLVWGRIYYTDGSYYTGKINDSQPNGNGVLVTKNRKILKGNFNNGELSEGEIEYESTDYRGQIKNGIPNGYGQYRDNNYTYDGEWENGKRVNGKLIYADGTVFEGLFSENLPSSGKFLWKNGTVYEGDLKNFTGVHYGTLINQTGSYEGQWNGNNYHGKGTYIWKNANSNKYEGDYKQGKKEGKGTYYLSADDFFRGTWKIGKQDGEGEFVRNGRIIKGRWRKGTFVNILGDSQPGDEEAMNFDVLEEVNNIASLPHLTKP